MKNKTIIVLLIIFILGMIGIVAKDMIENKAQFIDNQKAPEEEKTEIPEKIERKIAIISSGVNLKKVSYNQQLPITTYNILDKSNDIDNQINNQGTIEFAGLYNNFNSLNLNNELILIKAFDDKADLTNENILEAIKYAQEQQAKIINIPFSFTADEAINNEIAKCIADNIIVVVNGNTILDDESQAIFVMNKPSNHVNEIIIDNKNQLSCLKKVCKKNNKVNLSSTLVTGFLANEVNYKEFLGKTLVPKFTIQP